MQGVQDVQDVGKEAEMSRGKYVKNIDWGKYDKTIVKMRSAGASYRMIAEKIMINDQAVRDHAVKHLGFTVHKKPEDWEILALLEQGMNFREASKSSDTIKNTSQTQDVAIPNSNASRTKRGHLEKP